MKYSEFCDLCRKEWENGRGDIVSLDLTDDSAGELADEVLMNGAAEWMEIRVKEKDLPKICAGFGVSAVVNPVTRTTIEVNPGHYRDTCTVIHICLGACGSQ